MRTVSGFTAFLLVASTCLILMSAGPAHAACVDYNDTPALGKVLVCVNDDGTAEASWSTFDDETGVHRLFILVGPDYVGVCQDYPDPANCTPDLIEL